MDQAIRDYLNSVDVAGHWEYPPDTSYVHAFENLIRIKKQLEKIASTSLFIDKNVQDASFITDIWSLNKEKISKGIVHDFTFRFSHFGNMFSLMSNENIDIEERYNIKECISYLTSCDLKYIPESELQIEYDGINKPYQKGLTWWVRYFDYL